MKLPYRSRRLTPLCTLEDEFSRPSLHDTFDEGYIQVVNTGQRSRWVSKARRGRVKNALIDSGIPHPHPNKMSESTLKQTTSLHSLKLKPSTTTQHTPSTPFA